MTSATTANVAGEIVKIDPIADKPSYCPAWCRGHSEDYARDFGTFKSREEMENALAQWRTHHRYIAADVKLWTLTHDVMGGFAQNWVERPTVESYDLTLECSGDLDLTPVVLNLVHRTELHMTTAEARQLAAYLIRAADVADRDESDR